MRLAFLSTCFHHRGDCHEHQAIRGGGPAGNVVWRGGRSSNDVGCRVAPRVLVLGLESASSTASSRPPSTANQGSLTNEPSSRHHRVTALARLPPPVVARHNQKKNPLFSPPTAYPPSNIYRNATPPPDPQAIPRRGRRSQTPAPPTRCRHASTLGTRRGVRNAHLRA